MAVGPQLRHERLRRRPHRLVLFDHEHDHLCRRQCGGEAEPEVVAVPHHQGPDEPGRGSPGRLPDVVQHTLVVGVGDPEGREKFWPSSWLVAICSALPSPIIPSQVQVRVAPANRSRAVLCPVSTGSAATSNIVAR